MQVEVVVHGRKDRVYAALFDRCDRTTRHRLAEAGSSDDTLPEILAAARLSPGLELRLSGISLSGNKTDDLVIAHDVPFAARARALAAERIGVAPDDPSLTLALHLSSVPYFLARYRQAHGNTIAQSDLHPPLPSPAGQTPGVIIRWFDASLGRAV
ncbi:MAG: hypothetical protein ABF823_12700, partial [Acetobacter syzygii]